MRKTLSVLFCVLLLSVPFLSAAAERVTVTETFTAPPEAVYGGYVSNGEYFTLKLDCDDPDVVCVDGDGFRLYNNLYGSSITANEGITIDEVRFTLTWNQGAINGIVLFSPGTPSGAAITEIENGDLIDIKDINAGKFTISATDKVMIEAAEVTVIGHKEVTPTPTPAPTPAPDPAPDPAPETGDSRPIALCAAALLISAGVFAFTVRRRRNGC